MQSISIPKFFQQSIQKQKLIMVGSSLQNVLSEQKAFEWLHGSTVALVCQWQNRNCSMWPIWDNVNNCKKLALRWLIIQSNRKLNSFEHRETYNEWRLLCFINSRNYVKTSILLHTALLLKWSQTLFKLHHTTRFQSSFCYHGKISFLQEMQNSKLK